jgi:hypothetical protein
MPLTIPASAEIRFFLALGTLPPVLYQLTIQTVVLNNLETCAGSMEITHERFPLDECGCSGCLEGS